MTDREEEARLEELLMQRVTGALSAPEADALAQAVAGDRSSLAEWDAAAAELTALLAQEARTGADELPAHLADRIVGVGEALVRTTRTTAQSPTAVTPLPARPASPLRSVAMWGGWLAAAAAMVIWVASPRATPSVPRTALAANGAALRDSLLNADSTLVRLAWTATADSSAHGATGDVVWSAKAQRGVMRIAGLLPNDGKRWQYQLWIFDKQRDQKYPVDGGVFDIPPGSREVFVPIDARVPVGEAVMFAITVEKAGGVVVSTRERVALLAKPAG
jgi:hypothetical protein